MVEIAQSNVATPRRFSSSRSKIKPIEVAGRYKADSDLRDYPVASKTRKAASDYSRRDPGILRVPILSRPVP